MPDELPIPFLFRWAKARTIKTAQAILLDQSEAGHETSGAKPGSLSRNNPRTPVETRDLDADADPLYAILERETATDDAVRYAAPWQLATPAERRLLVALLAQLEAGRSIADGAIKAAAAHATLDSTRFEAEWNAGGAMALEEVIEIISMPLRDDFPTMTSMM